MKKSNADLVLVFLPLCSHILFPLRKEQAL